MKKILTKSNSALSWAHERTVAAGKAAGPKSRKTHEHWPTWARSSQTPVRIQSGCCWIDRVWLNAHWQLRVKVGATDTEGSMPSDRHFSMNPIMRSWKWLGESVESLLWGALLEERNRRYCGRAKKLHLDPSLLWTKALIWVVCVWERMDTITHYRAGEILLFLEQGNEKKLLTPGERAGLPIGFRSNPEEGWDCWEGYTFNTQRCAAYLKLRFNHSNREHFLPPAPNQANERMQKKKRN